MQGQQRGAQERRREGEARVPGKGRKRSLGLLVHTARQHGLGSWVIVGAVLKEITILGFGGPGLKLHVPKGHSYPTPFLEGEGRIYNVFGVREF
jgi:hypothetical protein